MWSWHTNNTQGTKATYVLSPCVRPQGRKLGPSCPPSCPPPCPLVNTRDNFRDELAYMLTSTMLSLVSRAALKVTDETTTKYKHAARVHCRVWTPRGNVLSAWVQTCVGGSGWSVDAIFRSVFLAFRLIDSTDRLLLLTDVTDHVVHVQHTHTVTHLNTFTHFNTFTHLNTLNTAKA